MPTQQPLIGLPRITITKDMVLRQIMYHEFPSHRTTLAGTDSLGLDEAPLQAYLQGLTARQLEFLLTYVPTAGEADRLVVFVSKTRGAGKLMGADFCNPPANTRATSNASFAVFHCRRNSDPILVCFTEEMCFASHSDMPHWFQSRTRKVDATKVLKICAVAPVYSEAWNVWHRVVTSNGTDVMPGAPNLMNNSIHGEINTQGCWMLFRNFNWPRANYAAFEEAYRTFYRNENDPFPQFRSRLIALGYSTGGVCTDENLAKAVAWDRNRAYTRFTRHIVGIQYFSVSPFHSLFNTDGEHFHPTATQDYLAAVVPGTNAHNFQVAVDQGVPGFSQSADIVTAPNSLFDDSRLQFRRQQRWAPTLTRDRVTQPTECSWADLVLFE